jgi:antitoxin FitA
MTMKPLELPEDIAAGIEQMAAKSGMTPEMQIEILLRQSLGEFSRREFLFQEAERIAAMTPKGVKQTDSTILIREDRDR